MNQTVLPTSESSRKFRPILPKTATLVRSSSKTTSRRQLLHTSTVPRLHKRACQVVICTRPNCALRTHHRYGSNGAQSASSSSQSRHSDHHDTDEEPHRSGTSSPSSHSDISIINGGVDGLPTLPLDGIHKSVFRKHFHQFFGQEYAKVTLLLVPPPITKNEKAAAARKKYETLETALTIPAFCLNCIAAAHHQTVFRKDSNCPDANTMLIHSKITMLLRGQLIKADRRELKDLLYIIFTLVMYEMAYHKNRRAYALPLHRSAIGQVVAHYGGVQNMGEAIPYVYSLDRILSLFTDEMPRYAPRINRTIRRPCKDPYIYGAFFESPGSTMIHQSVREYGFDTCRAIDLVERTGWIFGYTKASSDSMVDIHYLYFLKDCVINQYAYLNAEMAGNRDISRCILVATKMVEYVVLQDTYFVTVPMHLADKLHNMISGTTDTTIIWTGLTDVLIWILFVLTCVPVPWEKRQWALMLLKLQLDSRHTSHLWPFEWRETELGNLRQFAWSETRLNDSFRNTCNELADLSNTLSRESTE